MGYGTPYYCSSSHLSSILIIVQRCLICYDHCSLLIFLSAKMFLLCNQGDVLLNHHYVFNFAQTSARELDVIDTFAHKSIFLCSRPPAEFRGMDNAGLQLICKCIAPVN